MSVCFLRLHACTTDGARSPGLLHPVQVSHIWFFVVRKLKKNLPFGRRSKKCREGERCMSTQEVQFSVAGL